MFGIIGRVQLDAEFCVGDGIMNNRHLFIPYGYLFCVGAYKLKGFITCSTLITNPLVFIAANNGHDAHV